MERGGEESDRNAQDAADRFIQAAPAKVNLSLQIIGKRRDGYHLLDSLVVFAAVGDDVLVRRAARLSLAVRGPFAFCVAALLMIHVLAQFGAQLTCGISH